MLNTGNHVGGYKSAIETLWDIIISFNEHDKSYSGELRYEVAYGFQNATDIFTPLHMFTLYYDDLELLAIDYVLDETYGLDISDIELHRILSLLVTNCIRHICSYGLDNIINQAVLNDQSYSYTISQSEHVD